MVAIFGEDDSPSGIHLTRLAPDGKGKAGSEVDKVTIGPSMGEPIIIHINENYSDLVIAEGIEDACSLAIAIGWTTWAAGTSGRLPHCVKNAAEFSRVFIAVDGDEAGRRALIKVKKERPDAIPINFDAIFPRGQRLDANKIAGRYGDHAIRAALQWATAQHELRTGQIGFNAFLRLASDASSQIERVVQPSGGG